MKEKDEIIQWNPPHFKIRIQEKVIAGFFFRSNGALDIHLPTGNFRIRDASSKSKRARSVHPEGSLSAPMPGKVVKVFVREGDPIKKGEVLMVLEAMKMEHKIVSPKEGKVLKIRFKEGDRVSQEEDLVELE
jgi:biotin carboxyl carrier protein